MSTGTKIVRLALQKIGVYSVVNPTNSETLEDVKDELNSLLARWQDDDIDCGAVPLNAIGDEFSEPLALTSVFSSNLAVTVAPMFPAAKVSPLLISEAKKGCADMITKYQTRVIPKKQVRSTTPKGQGNRSYWYNNNFFTEGEEVG